MKKYTLLILILLLLGYTQFKAVATPLSGSYTIDATLPATATNFQNFASAITYLTGPGTRLDGGVSNTAPYGMSGPVEFFVHAGMYDEQVRLNGDSIPGLSYANPLTFSGDNAYTTILSKAIPGQPIMLIKNCKYVTLRNLGIKHNAPYGAGILLVGSDINKNGSGCRIVGCNINIRVDAAITSYNNFIYSYGIQITGDTLGAQLKPVLADSITIDSNTIYAATGIAIMGPSYLGCNKKIVITADSISSISCCIKLKGINNGFDISHNTLLSINMSSNSNTAIDMNRCMNRGPQRIRIFNNNIVASAKGINFNFADSLGNPACPMLIYNNMIVGNLTGITIYSTQKNFFEIYHNSIYMSNHTLADFASIYALTYYNPGGTLKCKNNIFAVDPGITLYGYPVGIAAGIGPNSFDKDTLDLNCNIYYNATNPERTLGRNGNWNSTNIRSAAGGGDSSFCLASSFVSTTDLHLTDNTCRVKGAILPGPYSFDLDGNPRSGSPEIGCFEYHPVSLNLKVTELSVAQPLLPGPQSFGVTVYNNGLTPVTTFTVAYKLDTAAPVIQTWMGYLGPCDTITVFFTGAQQLDVGLNSQSVKAYVYAPNGGTDEYTPNDTMVAYSQMAGTYTIGSAPSDYPTFAAAINDLSIRSIKGPVTFSVKAGVYNTAVDLNGLLVKGVSPINRITFDGNNVAVINSTTAATAAVSIRSFQYVTVQNFTINSAGSGVLLYGSNFYLRDGTGCKVKNCIINIPAGSTYYGIRAFQTVGRQFFYGDSIEIDSNTISGGNTGIMISAFTDDYGFNAKFKIRRNTINNATTYGIYVAIVAGLEILNNSINKGPNNLYDPKIGINAASVGIFVTGIHTRPGDDRLRIIGNKITCKSVYGIWLAENFVKFPSEAQQIYNNSIANSTNVGILIWCIGPEINMFYTQLYHNTVIIDTAVAKYCVQLWNENSKYVCEAKNNIFAVTATKGTAIPVNFQCSSVGGLSPGNPNDLNYNNYYNASGPGLVSRATVLSTDSMFKTTMGGGTESVNEYPDIYSSSDLRLTSGCKLKGTNMLGLIPVDALDSVRHAIPNMGAYEFQPKQNDVGVEALLKPVFPINPGLQDVKVRIMNFGLNTIDSVKVNYKVGAGAPVTKTWNGALSNCDTVSVTFTGSQQINIGTSVVNFKAYTQNPNGLPDENTVNDTLSKGLSISMHGIYTIGGLAPDFVSFNAAVTALTVRGIDGAVIFKIRNGTYTEQVLMSSGIIGLTDVNTITFEAESGISDSVKLTFAAGSITTNYLVKLFNVSYITFRNITFLPTSTTYGRIFELAGTSSFDTVENCKFVSIPIISPTPGAGIYSYLLSGGNHVIRNNTFIGCVQGIYLAGNSATSTSDGNMINNNTFLDIPGYNISLNYMSNIQVKNNVMTTTSAGTGFQHVGIIGGYLNGSTEITRNKITFSTGGSGIQLSYVVATIDTPAIITNNSIALSGTGYSSQNGFQLINSSNARVHHNSVNIEGTIAATSTPSVAAFFTNNVFSSVDIRNNIFANTGLGPAAYLTLPGNMDYNLFYCTNATVFKSFAVPTSLPSLAAWRTYFGTNLNSLFYRPAYTGNTDLTPNPADSAVWAINGRGTHLDSAFGGDFNGTMRPIIRAAGVPDLGAYEVIPTALPPEATTNPAQFANDSTQYFFFAGDTIASIKWDFSMPLPASLSVKQYSGKQPSNTHITDNFMYFYVDVLAPPGSINNYFLKLYYKDPWVGTLSQELVAALAFKNTAKVWSTGYSSAVDTVQNFAFTSGLFDFGLYTLTDGTAPLPVQLLAFSGNRKGDDVVLNWRTANEVNCNRYVIERSFDNINYTQIGNVQAEIHSAVVNNYTFVDRTLNTQSPTVFYRLKMIDNDGSFEYSKVIALNLDNKTTGAVAVYPNPFGTSFTAVIDAVDDGTARIELMDVFGKTISVISTDISKGANPVLLNTGDQLPAGMYILKVNIDGQTRILKIMKE